MKGATGERALTRKDKERGDEGIGSERKRWRIGSDSKVKKDRGEETAERETVM